MRSLTEFTLYTYRGYIAERAHRLIADYVMQVVEGTITRLMVWAPPQIGKSELISVRLPAYWLGRYPDTNVILTSYAASLAENKSRQARDLVDSAQYRAVFPQVSANKRSRAVNAWSLDDQRGGMIAAGVGGPITGHGAMLGIIDDPVENWEQAQSATYREKTWEWYRSTFRTRLQEGGRIVFIMTRWSDDDLAGRVLRDGAEDWTVIRLPAIAETQEERDENNRYLGLPVGQPDPLGRAAGEPLAPARFSLETLQATRTAVGGRVWSAEYQGVPRDPEGNLFKRQWFEIIEVAPGQAQRVRYWDKAGTEGGGAFTAGVLLGKTKEGLYFIEDVVRGQWSAWEREKVIRQTAVLDAAQYGQHVPVWLEQDGGSGGKESAENTIRHLAGFVVRAEQVTGSKRTRAEPFRAQCEALNVKLVRAAWNGPYLEELISFPSSKYKDQVDASSGAFNKLAGMIATEAPWPVVEEHTFSEEARQMSGGRERWVPRIV